MFKVLNRLHILCSDSDKFCLIDSKDLFVDGPYDSREKAQDALDSFYGSHTSDIRIISLQESKKLISDFDKKSKKKIERKLKALESEIQSIKDRIKSYENDQKDGNSYDFADLSRSIFLAKKKLEKKVEEKKEYEKSDGVKKFENYEIYRVKFG